MAFEIGGLVGHDGVADCVGFVEGVVGKVVDVVINLFCDVLRDAVGHAPLDVPLRVAVDERLPLLLDLLGLLLGDGTAHHVSAAQGVASQLLEDHHDLFLVDDTAVGDGQDGFQAGMQVAYLAGVQLAGDEPWDGVHGAGAVEGDDRGQILDGFRLHLDTDAGHAGGFHLEDAGGAAAAQHFKGLRVVVRQLGQLEVRLPPLDELFGVVQNSQVAQAQEVHLQQTQLLQGGHHVLGDHALVVPGQGHVVVHRQTGDDHAGGVLGGVARHPLDGTGGVDEVVDAGVVLVLLPEGFR